MKIGILYFRVIKGENKGKEVYAFQDAYADALMSPIPAIPTYDDNYEYVMFLNELELVREEVVEVEDDTRRSTENP